MLSFAENRVNGLQVLQSKGGYSTLCSCVEIYLGETCRCGKHLLVELQTSLWFGHQKKLMSFGEKQT